jgi:hypothetical protein
MFRTKVTVSRLEWQLRIILPREMVPPGSKMDAAKHSMSKLREREMHSEKFMIINGIRGMRVRVDSQV